MIGFCNKRVIKKLGSCQTFVYIKSLEDICSLGISIYVDLFYYL